LAPGDNIEERAKCCRSGRGAQRQRTRARWREWRRHEIRRRVVHAHGEAVSLTPSCRNQHEVGAGRPPRGRWIAVSRVLRTEGLETSRALRLCVVDDSREVGVGTALETLAIDDEPPRWGPPWALRLHAGEAISAADAVRVGDIAILIGGGRNHS